MADFRNFTVEEDEYTLPNASTSKSGIVQLTSSLESSSEDQAATAKAAKDLKDALDAHEEVKASTTQYGHTKLVDSIPDEDAPSDAAATPNAVREALTGQSSVISQHKTAASSETESGHCKVWFSDTGLYIAGAAASK